MRYVFIPLPLITGGKPGAIYLAEQAVQSAARE
jgi:hypothetical protein